MKMIPTKITNCTWIDNGTHLAVTNDTDEIGEIIFGGKHKITFPPRSEVKLCDLVFGRQDIIVGYIACKHDKYIGSLDDYYEAEPVKTKVFIIDAVSMMKGLIERGYTAYSTGFIIERPNDEDDFLFVCKQFKYCGLPKIEATNPRHTWEPWMLIEKEVTE